MRRGFCSSFAKNDRVPTGPPSGATRGIYTGIAGGGVRSGAGCLAPIVVATVISEPFDQQISGILDQTLGKRQTITRGEGRARPTVPRDWPKKQACLMLSPVCLAPELHHRGGPVVLRAVV